ncbi:MAG: serine/threonine-protein kinase [Planctomycetota bacterium]
MADGRPKSNSPFDSKERGFLSRLFRRGHVLEAGDRITGRGVYKIKRVIGEGGMGRVYLAEKLGAHGFSKLMAIKVLRKDRIRHHYDAALFFEEARLTGNLVHPNIIQTYQMGEKRHFYFIVMEHVFGVTLLEFIERHAELGRSIPIGYGAWIMNRVLSGLHYAHNKHSRDGEHLGIVHRDICPSNIMISFRGVPKLFDFGVANFTDSPVDEKVVNFGKYPYMAPEQVQRRGTDARSDLYSLGLVMYECFTGKLVHEVENTAMLLEDFEHKNIVPPHELIPDIPQDLSDLILKAIKLEPEKRFRSAKVMRQALDNVMFANFLFPDPDDFADYLTGLFPAAAKHRWW